LRSLFASATPSRRVRLGAAFVAAVVFHATLLAALRPVGALRDLAPDLRRPIEVELITRWSQRARPVADDPDDGEPRPNAAPAPSLPVSRPPASPDADHAEPRPLAPSSAAVIAGALRRSLGCRDADFLGLTREEREACARRFIERSDGAQSLPILSAERRRPFDEVRERWSRPMPPPIAPCDGPKSNLGAGCLTPKQPNPMDRY